MSDKNLRFGNLQGFSRQTVTRAIISLNIQIQWQIQGRGLEGQPPLLDKKGQKNYLEIAPTPLSQGLQTKISREETDRCMENLKQATGEIRHRCAPQDL